jgi:hypothetical protein
MLIGFNNDVEFNGRMFHIQTEDNGVKNASITTILFYQGQILDRRSTSYSDIVKQFTNEEERNKAVKKRMVELHRTLYKNLFDGNYEEQTDKLQAARSGEAFKGDPSKSMAELKARPTTTTTAAPPPAAAIRANPSASSPGLRPIPTPDAATASAGGGEVEGYAPITRPSSIPHLRPLRAGIPGGVPLVEWSPTGQRAFRGTPPLTSDLRLDGLVASFIDSLS